MIRNILWRKFVIKLWLTDGLHRDRLDIKNR